MPEWSLLQWLDAGTVPLLMLIVLGLWRIDRRLYKVEIIMQVKKTP